MRAPAHRTERRDVLYPLHPWFGRDVFVHGATDKANGVFRCTLDGSGIARSLEIPFWMFDRAVCVSEVRFAVGAFVDLEALGALSALLDQVLKSNAPSSNARLLDAYGASRDQNQGESHGAEDDGVGDRGAAQAVSRLPTDGFVYRPMRGVAPDWPDLPEDARGTLINLMTRLILEHAQAVAAPTTAGAGHDR